MRILIHSNAPWVPTGYGKQTALLMEQLRKRGHTVGVSAFAGLHGADIKWKGYQILPTGQMDFGVDVLLPHIQRFEADLVITLMDFWKLAPIAGALKEHAVAAWLPVDCSPISHRDAATLGPSGVRPIAMSRFGQIQIEKTGAEARYAPHAVDTAVFSPMEDRAAFRGEMELDDKFVIGICAANSDSTRKAFPEQFKAFAELHRKHPDTVLLVHSLPRSTRGLDLFELAGEFEIAEAVRFTDQYVQDSGLMDDEMMRRWYSALDVLSLCSYAEGFGVPLIEAQACGTPVITTNASASAELMGSGWLVQGDPFWNPVHNAWWQRPRIADIAKIYNQAYNLETPARRDRARDFALGYDVNAVAEQYWEPILKELDPS